MMKNNYIKQKRKDQNPVNHWKIFEGRLVFLLAMVILAVVAYTFILQQAYTKTALKTEIERDISSADAVHKLVNDRLGRKDFNEIKSKADENTELFKNMSTYMNEIRTLNSTRYIYTATRNEDGRLIYVVDGLIHRLVTSDIQEIRLKGDGSLYRKSTFWKNSIFSGYC